MWNTRNGSECFVFPEIKKDFLSKIKSFIKKRAHRQLSGPSNIYDTNTNWSPDSEYFIIKTRLYEYVYDTAATKKIFPHLLWNASFAPDGNKIASIIYKKIIVYDFLNGETTYLSGHKKPISCFSWSPNGANIVSGSEDSTVKIWQCDTGEEQFSFNTSRTFYKIIWSPDGSKFVASYHSQKISYLFDYKNLCFVTSIDGIFIMWSPSSKKIITQNEDGSFEILDIESNKRELKGYFSENGWLLQYPDDSFDKFGDIKCILVKDRLESREITGDGDLKLYN